MPKRRRKCFNCRHATVIRYVGDRQFPMGVFCGLDQRIADKHPFDYVHEVDEVCDKWETKEETDDE